MSKKKPLTSVFVVVSENGIEGTKTTFHSAKEQADNLWICEDKPSKILEVVNAWDVDLPEEPNPEISKMDLEDLE